KFAQTESFPLFVLAVNGAGVQPSDLTALNTFAQQIAGMKLVDENGKTEPDGKTIGDYLTTPPAVVPAQDGKAALITTAVDGKKIQHALSNSVSPIVAIVTTLRYNA